MVFYINFSNYKKLNEILNSDGMPYQVIKTVSSLSEDGKKLLNDYYDEDSYFFKHFNMDHFIHSFYASPDYYPTLYHYTNLNALKGITTSKELIVNSAHRMNDDKEIVYAKNMAIDIFKKYSNKEYELNYFIKSLNDFPNSIYIMSFTNNDHSQALSHYGDISIGMDNQNLQESFGFAGSHGKKDFDEFDENDFFTYPLKVNYDYEYQYNLIDNLVTRWIIAYRNISVDPFDMKSILNDLCNEMFLLCLLFKRPVLYQEEEIRYICQYVGDFSDYDQSLHIPFNVNLFNSVIYSHDCSEQKDYIKKILYDNGFLNVDFHITDLPY